MKKLLSVLLSLCLLLSLMPLTAYAIEVDTTPPEIHIDTLTMTLPDGKDTVTIDDKIKLSVEVTDESEINYVEAYYYNYAVEKGESFSFTYNAQSGKFECEKTIDNNVASGEWKLLRFSLRDSNDNYGYYYNTSYSTNEPSSDLDAFNFTVVGTNPDITPPVISIGTFTMTLPDGKDAVTIGDTIKFSVEVTDESEIDHVEAYYYNHTVDKGESFNFSYNAQSGKFEYEKTIDNYVASGEWKLLRFSLRDNHDNYAYYYNTSYSTNEPSSDLDAFNYTVEGTNPDITPPVINIGTFTMTLPEGKSKVIAGDKIKFSVEVTDESEIDTVEAYYYNYAVEKGEAFYFSYNAQSGKYEYEYTVGENTPTGEWKLLRFSLRDNHDNYAYYYNTSYSTNEPSSDLDAFNYTVAETCKITFDSRGGTPVEPIYVEKGTYAAEPEKPTREDASFGKWYTDEALTDSFWFKYDKVNSDMTLYAMWYYSLSASNWDKTTSTEAVGGTYDVNYMDDIRGCANIATIETEPDFLFKAHPDVGYKFVGWYKGVYRSDISGQHAEPLDLNNPENLISTESEFTYTLSGTAVVIAVFEECTDHVSDSGTVTKQPTYTEPGEKVYHCAVCGKELNKEPLPKLPKLANTLYAKGKKPAVKYSKTKKRTIKRSKAITVKNAVGKLSYKKVKGNKKITVSKSGKITVKKGLKKGTYTVRIKVTAAGNSNYNAAVKTVKVKIRVK